MPETRYPVSYACLCGLALLLAACGPSTFSPLQVPIQEQLPTAEPATPTSQVEQPTPLPTQVLAGMEQPVEIAPTQPPPEPLRFVFPSPVPDPVSAWRPPLYPVPWEPTPYDHFYFSRPIAADEVNWPLADYRYGGVFFKNEVHTGIDIPAPRGTPVLAAASGRVVWAGYGLYSQTENLDDPYGLAVSIKHDFGYEENILFTVYGHMDEIRVTRGQRVEAGDVIGLVGDTGHVTGVHLHFEVRLGKNNYFTSRNPELWISPPQGWGILAGRLIRKEGDPLEHHTVNIHSYDTGRNWEVKTYGEGGTANSDPYYRENMVIGDLPAGHYRISTDVDNIGYRTDIQVFPGMVSFFNFTPKDGLVVATPETPDLDFIPHPIDPTPTPTR